MSSLDSDEGLSELAASYRRLRAGFVEYTHPLDASAWLKVTPLLPHCSHEVRQLLRLDGCVSPLLVMQTPRRCVFRCHVRALHTTGRYLVIISIEPEKWGSSCGCPLGNRTIGVCKHATAALLSVAAKNDEKAFEQYLQVAHPAAHARIVEYASTIRDDKSILAGLPPLVQEAFKRVVARHKEAYQERKRRRAFLRGRSQFPREEANVSHSFTLLRNKVERRIETLKINALLTGVSHRVTEPDLLQWIQIAAALSNSFSKPLFS